MRFVGWRSATFALALVAATAVSAATDFVSTWKAPEATSLKGTGKGNKVIALVMAKNEGSRRAGEDALAREVTGRGAIGVPLYSITPAGAVTDEALARAAVEKEGAVGLVVLRPIGSHDKVYTTPVTYMGPGYSNFWGGYWGYGWGAPWGTVVGGEIRSDFIVYIEALVYSVTQNKLVWAGTSKSANPKNVDKLVKDIVSALVKEMKKAKLL
jgi:hypothetical protein